ncbi:MAG: hypothetical protein K2P94_18135 [Rhodospirillaceae bacterium]|nr:hypothetical protein [Rhodospirillaceae bacterium]
MLDHNGVDVEGTEEADEAAAAEKDAEPRGMSDEQFKTLVGNEIRDALGYIDGEISPERALNYQYFLGEMEDVPAIEGRSSVVVRVVADYVGFILPSLLRTMIAGRKVVDYPAKGMHDEAAAKAASDYVNDVVLRVDNQIEREAYGWGFDGLVNKVGVLKVWWEEKKDSTDFVLRDLDEMQFVLAITHIEQQGLEIAGHETDAVTGLHTIIVRRVVDNSHVKFEVLPPEEFVISRDARSLENARLKSHRTYKYVGDLIAEGYDAEVVQRLPAYSEGQSNTETQGRRRFENNFSSVETDPMLRKVAVHAGTILCDKDGTGLKEWYFVAGGWSNQIEILEAKPFEDECYFCDFCPTPLPHLFFGRCPADDLIEIQRVQTVLARQTMDNIYLTNTPQQEVLVNNIVGQRLEYVQNKSPGGIIPVTALGAVNNVTVPFMAGSSLQLMQYWDAQAENRTGAGRNTMGLDPEVLQNQSATAARLQDSAAKLKMETIARIWAAGGMRKLGRAILRILKRRQDFARMVKMNGQETPVDPRAWAELEDWDVTVSTGLGTGNRERDLQMGGMILAKMEELLLKLGPSNPIVSLPMYSHALVNMAEAAGFTNAGQYFKPLPMDWKPPAAPSSPPPPPPQVIAAQIRAQVDREAARIKAQADAAKSNVENLTAYLLGIREQDLEAALERLRIERGTRGAAANIGKVPGQ